MKYAEQLADATCEIFSSMVMLEVTPQEATTRTDPVFSQSISGMVGLAGSIKGNLSIHMPAEVATAVTTAFLGKEVGSIDDDVCDAIGELANMLAGAVKNAIDPGGRCIKLSMPSTVFGDSYNIDCKKSGVAILVPFDLGGATFGVELQLSET